MASGLAKFGLWVVAEGLAARVCMVCKLAACISEVTEACCIKLKLHAYSSLRCSCLSASSLSWYSSLGAEAGAMGPGRAI